MSDRSISRDSHNAAECHVFGRLLPLAGLQARCAQQKTLDRRRHQTFKKFSSLSQLEWNERPPEGGLKGGGGGRQQLGLWERTFPGRLCCCGGAAGPLSCIPFPPRPRNRVSPYLLALPKPHFGNEDKTWLVIECNDGQDSCYAGVNAWEMWRQVIQQLSR
jgi:hypothetical protein